MDARLIAICLILVSSLVFAACWNDVTPGEYRKVLDCSFQEWESMPDPTKLDRLLDALFYVYVADGESPTMKQFFQGLRQGTPPYDSIIALKTHLVSQYNEGLRPSDIKELFLISQIDRDSVPLDVSVSMYTSIYRELERSFVLALARRGILGILPPGEYARILEIVKRMSWLPDPYLKAVNAYFQGVLYLHLGNHEMAVSVLRRVLEQLKKLSTNPPEKRILMMVAEVSILLQDEAEAETAYLTILKTNPQDWEVLMDLGNLLYRSGKCSEPGVWIEASMKPDDHQFELVIHCGSREIPDEELKTEPPAIAFQNAKNGMSSSPS